MGRSLFRRYDAQKRDRLGRQIGLPDLSSAEPGKSHGTYIDCNHITTGTGYDCEGVLVTHPWRNGCPTVSPTHKTCMQTAALMMSVCVSLQVAWVRHRDIHVLTVNTYTYTSDQRFQTAHHKDTDEWTLQIKYVQERDKGSYECQVSTQPVKSYIVSLNVVGECGRPDWLVLHY